MIYILFAGELISWSRWYCNAYYIGRFIAVVSAAQRHTGLSWSIIGGTRSRSDGWLLNIKDLYSRSEAESSVHFIGVHKLFPGVRVQEITSTIRRIRRINDAVNSVFCISHLSRQDFLMCFNTLVEPSCHTCNVGRMVAISHCALLCSYWSNCHRAIEHSWNCWFSCSTDMYQWSTDMSGHLLEHSWCQWKWAYISCFLAVLCWIL